MRTHWTLILVAALCLSAPGHGYAGEYSIEAIALQGQPTPVGGTYYSFQDADINDGGKVAFGARIQDSPATSGLFLHSPGVGAAARASWGASDPESFFNWLSMNSSGQIAYVTDDPSLSTKYLRLNDASGDQMLTSAHWIDRPSVNDSGLAFAYVSPEGLMLHDGTQGRIVAEAIDPHYGRFYLELSSVSGQAINASGQYVFHGRPNGDSNAQILIGQGMSHEAIFTEGDLVGGLRMGMIHNEPVINDNGDVAFFAFPGPTNILLYSDGQVNAVASSGRHLAMAIFEDDYETGDYGELTTSTLALSNNGDIVFRIQVGSYQKSGIGLLSDGEILPVVHTGDIAPDTGGLTFAGFGNARINWYGQVVFKAQLSDAIGNISSGIFVATPEPATLSLLALGACLPLFRRKRR